MATQERSKRAVVAVLLHLLQRRFLTSDIYQLHRAFFAARRKCPLIQRFTFIKTRGGRHICPEFDAVLRELVAVNIIRVDRVGKDLRYIIDDEARRRIEQESFRIFAPEELLSLSSAAAMIRKKCAV